MPCGLLPQGFRPAGHAKQTPQKCPTQKGGANRQKEVVGSLQIFGAEGQRQYLGDGLDFVFSFEVGHDNF